MHDDEEGTNHDRRADVNMCLSTRYPVCKPLYQRLCQKDKETIDGPNRAVLFHWNSNMLRIRRDGRLPLGITDMDEQKPETKSG